MEPEKLEAIKQWSNDPCGANAADDFVPGSKEYFERIEQNRYKEYAPWMKGVLPFARSQNLRVLEVGCGLGTDFLQFARGESIPFGIDLTPIHLRLTQRRLRLYGFPDRLAAADCERSPFAAESFDLIYSFGVIHHTPGTQQAVDEMYRVLKPGGTAWVGLYHRDSAYFWLALLLYRGIVGGELFARGWHGLLAQIEHRENSIAQPLVKVYSRRRAYRLFRKYCQVHISVHHLERGHFSVLGRCLPDWVVKRLEPYLGWYLVIQAEK